MRVRLSGLLAVALLPLAGPPLVAAEPPEVQVCTEVRILKVPAGFCEKAGLKPDGTPPLTADGLAAVLEAAQGHRETNVMQCPKVTTLDGRTATVRIGDAKVYVTGIEAQIVDGKVGFKPTTRTVELGDALTLCGKVSADGKFVNLSAKMTRTTEIGHDGGYPLAAMVSLIPEGGGGTLPSPQMLRIPMTKTVGVEKTAVVPSGGTVVLGGWKECGATTDHGPPVLSKIPYVNRLFRNASVIECEVIVLATARAIVIDDAKCTVGKCESAFHPADYPLPDRYNLAAPHAVLAPFAQQVTNGHVARQTLDCSDFEPATAKLTKAGEEKLKAIAAARPRPDTTVYLRTAEDVPPALCSTSWLARRDALTRERASVAHNYLAERVGGKAAFEVFVIVQPAPVAVAEPARHAVVHRLRHAAAADVAAAVTKQFGTAPGIVVVAEPVANTVLVSGEAAVAKKVAAMVAELDAAPQQMMVQALVMEVPQGWLADIGLSGSGKPLVLTERELAMFQAALRKEKEKGGIDILSRPQVQVVNNQTALLQVGGQVPMLSGLELVSTSQGGFIVARKLAHFPSGVSIAVTPQAEGNEGWMVLRVEAQVSSVVGNAVKVPLTLPPEITGLKEPVTYQVGAIGAVNSQAVRVAARMQSGQTMLLSAGVRKEKQVILTDRGERKEDGEAARETLIVLTPHRVRGDAVRPAAHPWIPPTAATMPATGPTPVIMPPAPAVPPAPAPAAPPAIPGPLPNGGIQPASPAALPTLPPPPPAPPRVTPSGYWGSNFGGVQFHW